MEIPDVQGLDKLYQAVSEALEIEKCSICLERLESTVLLWPCTHWFCNKCILTLHKSAKGEKVSCPLCKSMTTRRKVLPFQDKQTEYEDHLQTLIGALSLDLQFDVTSYNNVRRHESSSGNKIMETDKELVPLSPYKKTRTRALVRVIEVKKNPDVQQSKKRPTRRSRNVQPTNVNSFTVKNNKTQTVKTPKPIPTLLPETPDSPKRKKVKEWLDSNKFSQADQDVCVDTVVADVHHADQDESLCFSETALQSVSQVDHRSTETPIKPIPRNKPTVTPSDIDAIKVYNMPSENLFSAKEKFSKNQKAMTMPAVEKFDELFPENRKLQAVTTTYGSKNPYTSTRTRGQRFAVQVDLFNNIDASKGEINEKSSPLEALDNSEETLEDFSSGSGEEWTIEKVPRKCKLLSKDKTLKNITKQSAKQKGKNSMEKYVSAKPMESRLRNSDKTDLKSQQTRRNYLPNPNNYIEDKNKTLGKCVAVEEFAKPKDYIVKEIIDDWNDTKDSNNSFLLKSQTSTKHNENVISEGKCGENSETKSGNIISKFNRPIPVNVENDVAKTPCKEVNTRSPGWSRLKSTKKEFHLSDKKKLSLKTFNKSKSNSSLTNIGISPLLNNSKSTVSSMSKTELERSMVQSGISLDKVINSSKSEVDEKCKELNVDVPCDKKNQKTPELSKNLNTSLTSSASGSPFRGFPTPEEKDCSKQCVSSLNKIKETPQKSCNAFNFPQKNIKKSHKIPNENLEAHHLDSFSKEDPMEVDILPFEDPEIKFQREKKINENLTITSKMNKEFCKTLGSSNFLETTNVSTSSLEEPNRCTVFTKKRDRDSGIHNESGISSPIRKRVCRDAEVQTSPSRMESAIRDMLKDMCGIDLEEMIQQSNKADLPRNLNAVDVTSPNHSFTGLSQDSDKENVDISSKNQNTSKKCSDDSDIVLGTEDSTALAQINHLVLNEKIFHINYVDPDAPTQPNKTPVVRKTPLQTSTKEYTVVSNPTSSELKRTDSLFDKSDVIFPDETPKGVTPWNYSGVNQLEGNTCTVKKCVDENAILQSFPCLKEKKNRSRRQLDFVGESSNDAFEFESSDKLKEEVVNNESNNREHIDKLKTSHDKIEELDDIFMESNEPLDGVLNSPDKEESLSHKKILLDDNLEVNVETEIESENLSDTPGIVGPSEVQCFDSRVNLCAPVKQSEQSDSDKNISDKAVMCSPNMSVSRGAGDKNTHFQQLSNEVVKDLSDVQQDNPFMVKGSSTEPKAKSTNCINAQEDEASNPSSDISYVEGTPDGSQNEENRNDILNIEKDIKETGCQPLKIVDSSREGRSERESAKSEISLYDPSQKNKSLNIHEEVQQKDKETIIENNESVSMIENTEVVDENLCFASSLLNPQQNQVLACVLGGMGLMYSKTVGPHISHLIVGTKNGCFQNTYKVLLAMALHKPIIRFDWVEEVIRSGGTVPLDPFVALDPSGECGVLRAKADTSRKLLRNFAIHIYNVNDRIVLKEQIEELVRLCGGTVVKELPDFCKIPRDKYRIIVLSEPPDSLTQGDWRQKYSAVEVMIDWVYNTIGRYRVMPLVPFMVAEASDAVPFLQHEGYPKELIFDLSTQE